MATEEITCPSGLRVAMHGLKVRQYRRFNDKKALRKGEVFEEFLVQCLADVPHAARYELRPDGGLNWGKVLQGDRFASLLAVRIATHGPDFSFDVQCSRCSSGEPVLWQMDLRSLPQQPYAEEVLEAHFAGRRQEMSVGGRRVSWKIVDGDEEKRIAKHMEAARRSDPRTRGSFDPIVESLACRLQVEGVEARGLRAWIDDLDGSDLAAIRDELELRSGGVDTTIHVRHEEGPSACGGLTKVELPFSSEAFWLPRKQRQAPSSSSPRTTNEGSESSSESSAGIPTEVPDSPSRTGT